MTAPRFIAVVTGTFASPGVPESAQVFERGADGAYRSVNSRPNDPRAVDMVLARAAQHSRDAMLTEKPLRCPDCGSADVQCTAWVYVNTGEDAGDAPDDDVWCAKCEEHFPYGALVQNDDGPWALDNEEG